MHDHIPEPQDEKLELQRDAREPLPAPRHPITIGFAAWAALFLLVAYLGHGLSAGPMDVPAGMAWSNPFEAAYSSYDVVRGGQRLILESNQRTNLLSLAVYTLVMVVSGCYAWWGLRRRIRNKRGDRAKPHVQHLSLVVGGGLLVLAGLSGPFLYLHSERLDLDPAADQVLYDGKVVGRFQDVVSFEAYPRLSYRPIRKVPVMHTSYQMVMYLSGAPAITLLGDGADLKGLPDYLNAYLHGVRTTDATHK